jgi:hypothetical protein
MLTHHKDEYEGWNTVTTFVERNPDDWKKGDPIRYAAFGTANFTKPHVYPNGWLSKLPLSYPVDEPLYSYDPNKSHQAHEQVANGLHAAIDALKRT